MPSMTDQIGGKTFGRLTAIKFVIRGPSGPKWQFQCECGERCVLPLERVVSGRTRSCGCLKREIHKRCRRPNLIGKRFGHLVVERWDGFVKDTKQGHSTWLCKCDCGQSKVIREANLIKGHSESCGCMFRLSSVTHGFSNTPFYKSYIGHRQLRKLKGQAPLWDSFEEFKAETFEAFLEAERLHGKVYLVPKEQDEPLSKTNWAWGPRRFVRKGRGKQLEIRGHSMNITQWGAFLGVTRQRADQLDQAGMLEARVIEMLDN